ncbi:nanos RNA binding domain-containing protein [Phthorimaea operculella]|nr:nanos RNA binding domain-containing protein [Phthorimaea operculella]
MGLDTFSSDYGSGGSSMNSLTAWGSQELDWQTFQHQLLQPRTKAASYADLVNGRCTIEDVMQEFRMNGSDAPYCSDDDQLWRRPAAAAEITSTPSYMRQKSWPAPDRTPSQRLARPISVSFPMTHCNVARNADQKSWPAPDRTPSQRLARPISVSFPMTHCNVARNAVAEQPTIFPSESLTEEQRRVLSSLPDAAVLTLLREIQRRNKRQPEECRFCKNNGERESYYRSHVLKDNNGRVCCPVLRAFVCKRCGASGDTAHTIKYCPLSTSEERIKSAAMMRSVRLSSGRRRAPSPARVENYVVFGETPATVLADGDAYSGAQGAPLDPQWAQLEQKLML